MALRVEMVTCDSTDAVSLAAWWAEQVGGQVADPFGGEYVIVTGGPVSLSFQRVDDPTAGKNRLHLDLTTDDLDAEVDRLLAAGAGLVQRRGNESFRWVTLTDPDGNEFCVSGRVETAHQLTSVTAESDS
jgi:hypothetical protein